MDKEFETYYLAKIWKRTCARLIDILIISLIPAFITLIWYSIDKSTINSWKGLLIMIVINYLLFSLYFVIFPWKFNNQTLGSKLFAIKLVQENNEKIILKSILLRETILVFIPITLIMIAIVLNSIFSQGNIGAINDKTSIEFWISVLTRTLYSFVFAWYLGIMITVKVDKKHQLFYDRKYHLYVVNKKPVLKKTNPHELKIAKNNLIHIHLGTKQPGNIEQESLDEIKEL